MCLTRAHSWCQRSSGGRLRGSSRFKLEGGSGGATRSARGLSQQVSAPGAVAPNSQCGTLPSTPRRGGSRARGSNEAAAVSASRSQSHSIRAHALRKYAAALPAAARQVAGALKGCKSTAASMVAMATGGFGHFGYFRSLVGGGSTAAEKAERRRMRRERRERRQRRERQREREAREALRERHQPMREAKRELLLLENPYATVPSTPPPPGYTSEGQEPEIARALLGALMRSPQRVRKVLRPCAAF